VCLCCADNNRSADGKTAGRLIQSPNIDEMADTGLKLLQYCECVCLVPGAAVVPGLSLMHPPLRARAWADVQPICTLLCPGCRCPRPISNAPTTPCSCLGRRAAHLYADPIGPHGPQPRPACPACAAVSITAPMVCRRGGTRSAGARRLTRSAAPSPGGCLSTKPSFPSSYKPVSPASASEPCWLMESGP
jgi:hypothetical protein